MAVDKRLTHLLLVFVLAAGLFSIQSPAVQAAPDAALTPGDIAIIGFNYENPDNFAFVALVDIPVGTQIHFTDAGWVIPEIPTSFWPGEGVETWSAPANLPAGTVITHYIKNATGVYVRNPDFIINPERGTPINLQAPDDQIIAFTGTIALPLPIYALNSTEIGGWQASARNSLTSGLPHGLKDGETAVAFKNINNAVYTGPTTGTREELLAAISNPANWESNNSFPFDFSVLFPPGGGGLVIDNTPYITAISPESQAMNVPLDANIVLTFSEPVTTGAGWFSIVCDSSGAHTAQVSASGNTYTLDPDSNFAADEECTVTVVGASVTDQDGTANAMSGNYVWSFTTLPPVVFRYHDLEGVVEAGEKLFIAGDFNGWDPAEDELTPLGGGLYSASVEIPHAGTYEYRYYILSLDPDTGTLLGLLDSANRSQVYSGPPAEYNDYRSVQAAAAIVAPPTVSINQGGSMPDFYGQVSIPGVTGQPGAGRGLMIDFGSGPDGQITTWSNWASMTYLDDQGAEDRFTHQPAVPPAGQYYYGIRFDANWGAGNPNAGWTYAGAAGIITADDDTDPIVEDPGELTVTAPELALEKTVLPGSGVDLGDQVTYTLTLTNSGDGAAAGVALSDTLPAGLTFGEITSTAGAFSAGVISWNGDIPAGESVQVVFTADLTSQAAVDAGFVANTASFTAANAAPGEDTVIFNTVAGPDLAFTKTVTPEANVKLGGTVTYTLNLENNGDGNALNVALSDTLPLGLSFGEILSGGAAFNNGAVQWSGQVNVGQSLKVVFTAKVYDDAALYGSTITNTASYTSANAGEGQAQASFRVQPMPVIYMPIMFK